MKASLFSLVFIFLLSGCEINYNITIPTETLYTTGDYGWIIHDQNVDYFDEHFQNRILYLQTPYLHQGTKIYIAVYNDYDYAYINVDDRNIYLYEEWFNGDYEAHYVLKIAASGYYYFKLSDLHPDAVVSIYYE